QVQRPYYCRRNQRVIAMNTKTKSIIPIPKKLSSFITVFAAFVFLAFSAQIASAAKVIALSGNLNFGNVAVGTTNTLLMTVSNAGNATLQVQGIAVPAGFTAAPTNFSVHAGTA